MRSSISDPCSHNQHELCNDTECQCGCHFIARSHGPTPKQWKEYMKRVDRAESGVTEGME